MKRSVVDEISCVEDLSRRLSRPWSEWVRQSHSASDAERQMAVNKAVNRIDGLASRVQAGIEGGAGGIRKKARWDALFEAVCVARSVPLTDRIRSRIYYAVNTRNNVSHGGELNPERGQALAAILVCAWVDEAISGVANGGSILEEIIASERWGQAIPSAPVVQLHIAPRLRDEDIRSLLVQQAYRKRHVELRDVVKKLRENPTGVGELADYECGDFRPRAQLCALLASFRQMRDDPKLASVGRHLLAMTWVLECKKDIADPAWFDANFVTGLGPVDPDFFIDFASPAFRRSLLPRDGFRQPLAETLRADPTKELKGAGRSKAGQPSLRLPARVIAPALERRVWMPSRIPPGSNVQSPSYGAGAPSITLTLPEAYDPRWFEPSGREDWLTPSRGQEYWRDTTNYEAYFKWISDKRAWPAVWDAHDYVRIGDELRAFAAYDDHSFRAVAVIWAVAMVDRILRVHKCRTSKNTLSDAMESYERDALVRGYKDEHRALYEWVLEHEVRNRLPVSLSGALQSRDAIAGDEYVCYREECLFVIDIMWEWLESHGFLNLRA